MKIPNILLSELTRTELLVACKLYSLVSTHTNLNSKGFEICIKQETISKSCNLSISTVKRTISALERKNIILHKYRQNNAGGFLGAYHYTLKPFSFLSDYFIMPNHAFKYNLSPKLFYVYALCHKLKCSKTANFYQSYKDLSLLLNGMKKSEVIECIKKLIDLKLIRRQRKKTKLGDYTDNTYYVLIYQRGRIKKRKPAHNSGFPITTKQRNSFAFTSPCSIVSQIFNSVKTENRKKSKTAQKNFSVDGGG